MTIISDIASCVYHTSKYVSQGAANRLNSGNWRESEEKAIAFIQEMIHNRDHQANGAMIKWKSGGNGVSLESIVLKNPTKFTLNDVNTATKTLS